MRELKTCEMTQDLQKTQLRFADNYRLSQTIESDNRTEVDWRDLLKPFNRSHR